MRSERSARAEPSGRIGGAVFVKICGITSEADALFATAMGADAVGFIFAPSPRQVQPALVRDIVRRLPSEVLTVGVFRDESAKRVVELTNTTGLSAVQLHGHEAPSECLWIRERVPLLIKAFGAGDHQLERVEEFEAADAILMDSGRPGSGQVFDWSLVELLPLNRRVILAGGLAPDNVDQAIAQVRPWGVDVATGVEYAPGHKDARLVHRFVQRAKAAGAAHETPFFDGDADLMPFDYELEDLELAEE